ncbi:MAG: protein translocase subunit SecD, partial [Fimbriimonadaceae bacterium]|nr:protein translocase subunit SecD [Fimbriimonadaceae bacterium]
MQSKSSLFLLFVAVLTGLSIWGLVARKPALGLDINGGIRLTYQIDPETMTEDQKGRVAEIQDDLVKIMGARAGAALGVVEANVSKKGTDQMVIELPGYQDINEAKQVMSTTAKIQLFHARNVSNELRQGIYQQLGEEEIGGVTVTTFARRSAPTEVLRPGDEGYKRMLEGWRLLIEGGEISDAYPMQQGNRTVPNFVFSSEGGRKMAEFSRRNLNRQALIAFVLDGKVLSINPIQDGAILDTGAYINGQMDPRYVRQLTELVKAGALPVGLKELSSTLVDPTIGQGALGAMILAGVISLGVVFAFLISYYAFPGVVAAGAMALYAVFTIVALIMLNATFSLAGIAALILSIGMAADANILIFERLKEEIRAGKTIATATSVAFKRALAAIVDSNAATILTSFVLFAFGTGPVKGFATTLIVGVAISFFTAVAVTRALLVGLQGLGLGKTEKAYALNRNWFGEKLEQRAETDPMPVVQKSRLYFGISLGIMAFGIIFILLGGLKPNVEFRGGFEGVYRMTEAQSAREIQNSLREAGIEDANVKFGEAPADGDLPAGRLAYISVPYGAGIEAGDQAAKTKIGEAAGLSMEGASFSEIGPTISGETVTNSVLATVVSAFLIVLWLAIRFGVALGGMKNGLKFGLSAIVAMLHDIVVVFGVAAIVGFFLGWEISALFITAMLTVASFSVHDTIVIFDRIRENLSLPHKGQTFDFLVNKSITQTVARSINTSATAVV